MKKKLLIILPVVIIAIVGIAAYQFLMPKKAVAKPHLDGTVFSLPGSFTLNLAGGHYATLTVAFLLPATAKGGPADTPVIRSIITGAVTGAPESALIDARGRAILQHRILKNINSETNATVTKVYFTDLAVQ